MTGHRPDDLAQARAADQLNAWLDRHHRGAPSYHGEPPLAPTVREAARLAAIPVSDAAVRAGKDRLWEDLMQRHTATAPTARPIAMTTHAVTEPAYPRWQPRLGQPSRRSARAGHPIGHRVMGLVATLTIVALIGLLGLAVYLNMPEQGNDPTSMAALGVASTTTVTPSVAPTPARADATYVPTGGNLWTLPDSAFDELAPVESFGSRWQRYSSITLVQQPGTSFQIETRYYVNGSGSRIRVMLVRYVDDAQFQEAFSYFAEEIERYQETMYFSGRPGRTEQLQQPLAGCSDVVRAEGLEWVTSFPVTATLCRADNPRVIMLVSVNGEIDLYDGDTLDAHPADIVVSFSLPYLRNTGTPVPNP